MSKHSTTDVEDSTTPTPRRDVILDAAVQLIAAQGLAGLTHRAVDGAAGLAEGSTSYYFRRRADLVEAAAARVADRLADVDEAQRVAFAELMALGRRDDALRGLARGLVACADEQRHLFLARLELTLASSRDPELAPLGERLAEASRRPIEFYLRALTEGADDLPITTTASMLDGLALRHVTGEAPMPSVEDVVRLVETLLDAPGR